MTQIKKTDGSWSPNPEHLPKSSWLEKHPIKIGEKAWSTKPTKSSWLLDGPVKLDDDLVSTS